MDCYRESQPNDTIGIQLECGFFKSDTPTAAGTPTVFYRYGPIIKPRNIRTDIYFEK